MEYRKIIGFGKSSYVISIPKEWMKNNNLKKGSSVKIIEEKENLIISPLKDFDFETNEKTKSLNFESEKQLQRELISAYIEGYDSITIKGKNLEKKRNVINKMFENLIALEIVSFENNKVVAKDYLNLEDINLKSIIVKIDNNVKSMFLDLIDFDFKNFKEEVILSEDRDKSINKLSFLGFRVIRKLLNSPSKNNISILDLFKTWSLLVQLERIGDELKRIFRMFENDSFNNKIVKNLIVELYSSYEDSLKIFYNDKKQSFRKKNLEVNENIRSLRKKVRKEILNVKNDIIYNQFYEKIINISSYLEEILRLSFDFNS